MQFPLFRRTRAPRSAQWRNRPRTERPLRLLPISLALAGTVALAGAVAAVLVAVALLHLGPINLSAVTPSLADVLEIIKISLAVVAGIGGVVALVVGYRKQRVTEAGEAREQTKLYAERFDQASDKLGSDSPAVRLAGVHALASLADDWEGGRQMCIDVLCAYLRMPAAPEPNAAEDPDAHTRWQGMAEVRATILRLIAAHLRRDAPVPWHGADLDFTGVTFDTDVDFSDAVFPAGEVRFTGAEFSRGKVDFAGAEFSGSWVDFLGAEFSGGKVNFIGAEFSDGRVDFSKAKLSGGNVDFTMAKLSDARVSFSWAEFSGSWVNFIGAEFSGGWVNFLRAEFSGGNVDFTEAKLSGGRVGFTNAKLSGGNVDFEGAEFSGSEVGFEGAEFSGGKVDFSAVADWSHPPLGLPLRAPGLQLPASGPVSTGPDDCPSPHRPRPPQG